MERVKFFKYQGAGNDFIFIEGSRSIEPHIIQNLCHRNFGIGSDGLVIIEPSLIATAKMTFYNPDGYEAQFCGNATRCVVRHLGEPKVSIETVQGIVLGEENDGEVSIKMPVAQEVISPVALEDQETGHFFDIGIPHLLINVDDLDDAHFERKAKRHRYSKLFEPEGVNVSFIKEIGDDLFIRTYERGVEGETLACGTACTAAALYMRNRDCKKKSQYTVYPKSLNALQFTFDNQENIWMTGNALKVFEGEIDLSTVVAVVRSENEKGVTCQNS